MHIPGDRQGSPRRIICVLLPADIELLTERHFTYFYTHISAPHQLTNTGIRTRRLDKGNAHVTQIKAIQQVFTFQYDSCQREYDR